MSDIYCRKCGEPWDSYGITLDIGQGDMTPEEVKKFRRGEGCPSCGFGTKCTHCSGTGAEPGQSYLRARCMTCRDQHWTTALRFGPLVGLDSQPLQLKYESQRQLPANTQILEDWGIHARADGHVHEYKIPCPDCQSIEKCSTCGGDGKWHPAELASQLRRDVNALESLLDASDEEPIGLIDEFLGGE